MAEEHKSTIVVGKYKSEPRHRLETCRPPGLTSIIFKSLERTIREQLCDSMVDDNCISAACL